jgi:hypothetical protein
LLIHLQIISNGKFPTTIKVTAFKKSLNKFHFIIVLLGGSATIKAFIPEESYQLNIVSSIEERNECNNPMRAVELISDGDGAPFLIQSVGTNACLSSFGSEVGVASWVDCDFSNGIFRH